MIGNVALDVVIGLVFIYLLYSLYATIIMEIVSSLLGLRARNLCYALSRMLMDEKDYGERKVRRDGSRLATTFLRVAGKSTNMENEELYEKFFNQPSIKYLSSGGIGNKPSYLSAENFSKALIDAIKVDMPEVGELARIQMGLRTWRFKSDEEPKDLKAKSLTQADFENVKNIEAFLSNANVDLVKFKIWLKKWHAANPGNSVANARRSEAIKHINTLLNDANTDINEVKILLREWYIDPLDVEKVLPSERSETIYHIESLLNEANNDLVKFKILLGNWYNDTMERASGWFKQTTQAILIIIGAGLAIGFNVDTIAIIKKLSKDTEAREQLVKMAVDFNQNNQGFRQTQGVADNAVSPQMLNARLDSLMAIKNTLKTDIDNAQNILSSPRTKEWNFFGYVLTILALSLGAPFWFDLLNKLVKLRTSNSSSANTEGGAWTGDSNISNRNTLNRAG
ncbi:hypothetical protein [Dyadobacter arcticus]|uniref:Uncharacterized protein n=1 Tax=Dyadobacter arcticus TaxID=1078754 RepID=A0ABX0UNW5_9BACT|nr:hypothetical protein [Dyadobacter arcticus]NIJ52761.1 hypothetical protein [Dyadobacter arcticus]